MVRSGLFKTAESVLLRQVRQRVAREAARGQVARERDRADAGHAALQRRAGAGAAQGSEAWPHTSTRPGSVRAWEAKRAV